LGFGAFRFGVWGVSGRPNLQNTLSRYAKNLLKKCPESNLPERQAEQKLLADNLPLVPQQRVPQQESKKCTYAIQVCVLFQNFPIKTK
jgi:hypothetical protein